MVRKKFGRRALIFRWSGKHIVFDFCLCAFLFCASFLCCFSLDTITPDNFIKDSRRDTLVSPGEKFELGFFTPNGSSDRRRYVGIWYYNSDPKTVVWVANRDNPVLGSNGVLAITDDGDLEVADVNGRSYWSTNLKTLSSKNRTAKLMDSGNLVVIDENLQNGTLWQSFENPADTFLPGMKMDENFILSSWRSYDDPSPGNFTFQLDQEGENHFVIWKRSIKYWKSGVSGKFIGSDEMPSALSYLLSNFTTSIRNITVPHITPALYDDTRLVMSFSGQAQYFKWKNEKVWSLIWQEPRDRCSVYNVCGNFGVCNSNNNILCKCLPGFEPSSIENWNKGDFSGGCTRKSRLCGENGKSETFLSLKMMNIGNPDSQLFEAKNVEECKSECINNCQCQAYSYEEDQVTTCWIWSLDLNNLEEEYDDGGNLYVRVASYDTGIASIFSSYCSFLTLYQWSMVGALIVESKKLGI